jgi:hypothetical protein
VALGTAKAKGRGQATGGKAGSRADRAAAATEPVAGNAGYLECRERSQNAAIFTHGNEQSAWLSYCWQQYRTASLVAATLNIA